MPYAYDPNQDEDSQGQQQAPQLASGGSIMGGASSTTSPAGASGNPSSPTHSGNFQNLNSYLDANAGNGFGNQFVGKVSGDVNAASDAQAQGAKEFKNASDAATVKQDQGLLNQAFSDPYAFSKDQNNVQAFQNQANATYKGPLAYSDDAAAYQKAYGATQKAQDTANAAQSEGGRFALLNNYFGSPDYNQGQKSLDNLLIQADPTTSQGISQAKQNADQAQLAFQKQGAPLQNYAAQNAATTQATAKSVSDQANKNITGMQTDYGTAFTNAQTARANAIKAIQDGLSSGDTSQFQGILGGYGITQGPADPYAAPSTRPAGTVQIVRPPTGVIPKPGTAVPANMGQDTGYWGVNPLNFVTPGSMPDQSSVLSLAQQQKLNALEGLMNETQTPFNAAEAGQFSSAKPINFNTSAFKDAMNTAANNYGTYQSNIQGNVANLAGQTQRGNLGGQATPPNTDVLNQIQAQYDQLNKVRANYGLAPVGNPYAASQPVASPGAGPVRGGL